MVFQRDAPQTAARHPTTPEAPSPSGPHQLLALPEPAEEKFTRRTAPHGEGTTNSASSRASCHGYVGTAPLRSPGFQTCPGDRTEIPGKGLSAHPALNSFTSAADPHPNLSQSPSELPGSASQAQSSRFGPDTERVINYRSHKPSAAVT